MAISSIMTHQQVAAALGLNVWVLRHLMKTSGVRPLGRYAGRACWTVEQLPLIQKLAAGRRGRGRPRKG